MKKNPTIAAISTPQGTGAVGIVRISGPCALEVAQAVFRPVSGSVRISLMRGYSGALGRAVNRDGSEIDDVIAFVYRAPKSYTGEDVVELCCHGGSFAVRGVLRLCLDAGAEAASPGEFTKRAFLNGKLDLSQAEAVMDLIGAQGEASMRAALSARDGALSRAVDAVSDSLLEQAAHLAAWSDYPEEDLAPVDTKMLAGVLSDSQSRLNSLLETYDQGRILRQGATVAIAGKPNVGKSTLMNLLSGHSRSIVTDIPGTTRDVVEDGVLLRGIPLNLMDTAGIRETDDEIEREGVTRTLSRLETADLIVAVFDGSTAADERDMRLLELLRDKNCVAAINKCDLPQALDTVEIGKNISRVAHISARAGEGRDELEGLMLESLSLERVDTSCGIIANERQRRCVSEALGCVDEALGALESGMTLDAVGVCIDCALDFLLSLTGRRVSDTVVDEVFSRFCVGK